LCWSCEVYRRPSHQHMETGLPHGVKDIKIVEWIDAPRRNARVDGGGGRDAAAGGAVFGRSERSSTRCPRHGGECHLKHTNHMASTPHSFPRHLEPRCDLPFMLISPSDFTPPLTLRKHASLHFPGAPATSDQQPTANSRPETERILDIRREGPWRDGHAR
jgi:hypothetical protein